MAEMADFGLDDNDVDELCRNADLTIAEADKLLAKARSDKSLPKALLDEVEAAIATKGTLSHQQIKHIKDQLKAAEQLKGALDGKVMDLYKRQAELFEKWPIYVIMNGSHRVHPV